MTRKDYQLIADSFAATRSRIAEDVGTPQAERMKLIEGVDWAIRNMSAKLAAENPRFDRNRFLHAAGFWTKHFEA